MKDLEMICTEKRYNKNLAGNATSNPAKRILKFFTPRITEDWLTYKI